VVAYSGLVAEVVHGITGLGRERADAGRLLERARGHRGIGNRLYWVRDVMPGEDACRARSGSAPQVLAAFRKAVVHLLEADKAAARRFAARPFAARPFAARRLVFAQGGVPWILGPACLAANAKARAAKARHAATFPPSRIPGGYFPRTKYRPARVRQSRPSFTRALPNIREFQFNRPAGSGNMHGSPP
jgi:hypothetical protein